MSRKGNVLWFLALFLAISINAHALARVVISEVMWSGTDLSSADEWFELANTSTGSVNISGWKITRLSGGNEVEMLTIGSGSVAGSGFFLISNFARSTSRLDIDPDLVTTAVTLDNTKLLLRLYDASNTLIDAVDDGVGAPFAGSNTTPKASMERIDLTGSGQLKSNWKTATTFVGFDDGADIFGTPGAMNGTGPGTDTFPPKDATSFRAQTDSGALTLLWTRSTSLDLLSQSLSFSPPLTNRSGTVTISASADSYITTEVQNGSGYTVIHRSIDNDGNTSSGISLLVVVDPDLLPPGDVASLRAVHVASGVVLTWTPPNDNDLDDILVTRIPSGPIATLSGGTSGTLDGGSGTGSVMYTLKARDLKGNTSTGTTVTAPPFPNILISEVLSDPSGTETENEWIELLNTTSSGVDLDGLIIDDSGSSKPYTIPQGTVLASGTYLSFRSATTGLGLTNAGETVSLSFRGSTIASLTFPETAEDISYGLLPGTVSSYGPLCTLTEGHANASFPPEPLIIIQSGVTQAVGSLSINLEAGIKSGTTAGGVCGWDYRDGFASGSCNPGTHAFTKAGTYDVLLSFTNICGTSGIATLTISVDEASSGTSGAKSSSTSGGGGTRLLSCPVEATGGIHVNEILPNPLGDDKEGEFVELMNTLDAAVKLCGWTLDDIEGGSKPKPLDDFTIAPKGFLVLPYHETTIALNNDGDSVRLSNAIRNPHDEVHYTEGKEGWSYARTSTGTFTWTPFPTPGGENIFEEAMNTEGTEGTEGTDGTKEEDAVHATPRIFFSEVMSNPPREGALNDLGEYVEIINAEESEIDVGNFVIDDALRASSKPWTIPSQTTVGAHSFLLLPSSLTRISLNNEGETLHLYAPDGMLLSRVRYPTLQRGEAFALSTDESWCVTTVPTPGTENHCIPPEAENEKRLPAEALAKVGVTNERETERARLRVFPLPTVTRNILQTEITAPPRDVRPKLLRNLRDQVIRLDLPPKLTETGRTEEQEDNAETAVASIMFISSLLALRALRGTLFL